MRTLGLAMVFAAGLAAGLVAEGRAGEPRDLFPNSPWGVAAHPLRATDEDRERELAAAAAAGIKHLRTDFGLGRSPDADGAFESRLARWEKLLDQADRHGIAILPILQGYDWEIREEFRPLYRHPDLWRRYIRACAERFKGRLKVYEIWNEQDGGFWKPRPDAAQYVPLLKIAYEELKRVDPEITVVAGGLCGWMHGYLTEMYNAGAKGFFDVLAVHPYEWGPDASAKQAGGMKRFREVMAKHGDADKPVWITECGSPTHRSGLLDQQPDVIVKALAYALRRIGRPWPEKPVLGYPLSVERRETEPETATRPWLPGIPLTGVTPEALAKADPVELPFMIGTEHLAVERAFLEPMRDYVARGGVLLAFGAVPFYAERYPRENGVWMQKDNPDELHPFFRIGFEAWWTKQDIPRSTFNIRTVPELEAEGIRPLSNVYVTRYLSPKNLKPGDTYTPMVDAVTGEGAAFGQAMALYTFHDWKGAVLGNTLLMASGVGEAEQANLLQRVYLSYLASGVERIYFYDLRNDGTNPSEKEDNFGMVRRDFQPKPAYHAYQAMTRALGAAPRFEARETAGDGVWVLRFVRAEDGKKVTAAWALSPEREYEVVPFGRFRGTEVRFLEHP